MSSISYSDSDEEVKEDKSSDGKKKQDKDEVTLSCKKQPLWSNKLELKIAPKFMVKI